MVAITRGAIMPGTIALRFGLLVNPEDASKAQSHRGGKTKETADEHETTRSRQLCPIGFERRRRPGWPLQHGRQSCAARRWSRPHPGNTGQTTTTGSATSSQQPPTSTMSRATAGGAASSEDAQKQMQGQPTAAQQAQGATVSGQAADQGC